MIETRRLVLIPASVESLSAETARDYARFAAALGVAEPELWPPELYDDDAIAFSLQALRSGAHASHWRTYYLALKRPRVLIGAGGYVGAPDAEGGVEIGYSILPAHRRKRYASEATAAFVAHAFKDASIRRVVAHTYPDLVGSIGVLKRNRFKLVGPGEHEGTLRFVRERRFLPLRPAN